MICRWDRRCSNRAEGWLLQRRGAECSADWSRKLRRRTRGGSRRKRKERKTRLDASETRWKRRPESDPLASRLRLSLECSRAAQLQKLHPQRSTPVEPHSGPDPPPASPSTRLIARANTKSARSRITLPCSGTSPETGGERANTTGMTDLVYDSLHSARTALPHRESRAIPTR